MIVGRHDTYFTVDEFAAMVGRSPKTVQNWAAQRRMRFTHLCGVPLVPLSTVEALITGASYTGPSGGNIALEMMGRGGRIMPPISQTTR